MACYMALHVKADYSPSEDGFFLTGHFRGWESVFWQDDERGFWANDVCPESMWNWIEDHARSLGELTIWGWKIWPLWCVSGGMAKIAEGMFEINVLGEKPTGLFIASNPPTIIKITTPGRSEIKFIDLANYGLEPEAYRVNGDAGMLAATRQAVIDYHQLCRDWEMGPPAATAASQAWQTYRAFHQQIPPAIPPSSSETSRLEEAGYFGGRCECLKIGKVEQRLWHLDVTSMYTAIGQSAIFPREYAGCWQSHEFDRTPPFRAATMTMIADVTVSTDKPWYPASDCVRINHLRKPDRREGEERVIFPVGTFRTVLCGPELALAVGNGHVKTWHKVHYYDPSPLMASWSKWALAMRESVMKGMNRHMATCAKKIINSLPGKWGQHLKVWKDNDIDGLSIDEQGERLEWFQEWGRHPEKDQLTQYRTIAGQTQYLDMDTLGNDACPAVAAYWTAYGRTMLLSLIICAGEDHTYYYDTDSIFVDWDGYCRLGGAELIGNGEPGKLRHVGTAEDAVFLGIRRYFFNDKWHIAGPQPEVPTHEGFHGQMWKGKVGRPVETVTSNDEVKSYKHGTVASDGRVLPFVVGK